MNRASLRFSEAPIVGRLKAMCAASREAVEERNEQVEERLTVTIEFL
jgi:hypothetical protein